MANKGKGKEVVGKDSSGKRKRFDGNDKTGGPRRKTNREVLQFFEDAADAGDTDDSSDSDFDDGIESFIAFPFRSCIVILRVLTAFLFFGVIGC